MTTVRARTWTCAVVLALIPTPTAAAAPFASRPLHTHSRGADVRVLQDALDELGYPTASDGVFGRETRRSVRAYERDHQLTVDGRVSPKQALGIRRRSLAYQAPAAAPPIETDAEVAELGPDGRTATVPAAAPQPVKDAVAAANRIIDKPYRYGGGHGEFEDDGYDCSGSVSYVLHGAGRLRRPRASSGFERYGEAGVGEWISVYANGGHAYMVVAGLRFDTSGDGESGPRWRPESRSGRAYVVRRPSRSVTGVSRETAPPTPPRRSFPGRVRTGMKRMLSMTLALLALLASAAYAVGTIGTAGNDNLVGTNQDDTIDGVGGNDTISGLSGADTLTGGTGNDTIMGEGACPTEPNAPYYGIYYCLGAGPGDDKIRGNSGADKLSGNGGNDSVAGGPGNDRLHGGSGKDSVGGGSGNDKVIGDAGDDDLNGSTGNDVLSGQQADDHIDGGSGNDRLYGGSGDDRLRGQSGNDRLQGNSGNDSIKPGGGRDKVNGGKGNDRIYARDAKRDRIRCGQGTDRVYADRKDSISRRTCETIRRK